MKAEEIDDLLSFLKTETAARKSALTEAEVIFEEIKSNWWKKTILESRK